jgi:hypothetical protein
MRRSVGLSVLALAFVLAAGSLSATAAGSTFSLYDVSVQTRDGAAWQEGAPIVLVVRAASTMQFPDRALSVVMQTDGERTKCLDVAMKLVSTDANVATYGGVFYPFRAATYDGRFSIGEDVHEITFAVSSSGATTASIPPDAELPVLGPVRFDYGPSRETIAAIAASIVTAFIAAAMAIRRLMRRTTLPA